MAVAAYGLWPGVVAIVADADLYCVPCAKGLYGKVVIEGVVDGRVDGAMMDHEGNPFGVVLRGSEDLHTACCGRCRVQLCEEGCPCYQFPDVWLQHGLLVWQA